MAPDQFERFIAFTASLSRIETTLVHNSVSMERLISSVQQLTDAETVAKQEIVDLREAMAINNARLDAIEAMPWRMLRWTASGAGAVILAVIAHAQGLLPGWLTHAPK